MVGLKREPAKNVRDVHVQASLKRDVLERAWHEAGPELLLSIGQGIREAQYDPIWRGACQSKNPQFLFDKWHRFEKFSHSTNRLNIDVIDANKAQFERYTVDGGRPTKPENFLICGLMIALLEEIGCVDVRCEMSDRKGTTYCIRKNRKFLLPSDIDHLLTHQWQITWYEFNPRTAAQDLDIVTVPVSMKFAAEIDSFLKILRTDVSHQWKLDELARETGLSKRSLQRKLKEAGYSFSSLMRIVRTHEACALIEDSKVPLTTIAFCTGFSDSAHFSREFRIGMGMTPTDFRNGLLGK